MSLSPTGPYVGAINSAALWEAFVLLSLTVAPDYPLKGSAAVNDTHREHTDSEIALLVSRVERSIIPSAITTLLLILINNMIKNMYI